MAEYRSSDAGPRTRRMRPPRSTLRSRCPEHRAEWRVPVPLQDLDRSDHHANERSERGVAKQTRYHDRRARNGWNTNRIACLPAASRAFCVALLRFAYSVSVELNGDIVCVPDARRRHDSLGFQFPDCVIDGTPGHSQIGREPTLARSSTRPLKQGHDAQWIEALRVVTLGASDKAVEGTESPPLWFMADLDRQLAHRKRT